jgi:hypothetical protein
VNRTVLPVASTQPLIFTGNLAVAGASPGDQLRTAADPMVATTAIAPAVEICEYAGALTARQAAGSGPR